MIVVAIDDRHPDRRAVKRARGTIAIQLGPNGQVVSAKVMSMSGGTADQWERAMRAAEARLRAARLQMPEAYKKGAVVYIDAVSHSALPRLVSAFSASFTR